MKKALCAALWLCLCLCAPPAGAQTRMTKQTDAFFSTVSMLSVYVEDGGEKAFEQLWSEVKALLGEIERTVSVSDPESDIARFNALPSGQSCEVSPMTAELLSIARDVFEETAGLYDPTVYPLVDLWGFSPRFNRHTYAPERAYDRAYDESGLLALPAADDIAALLPLVSLDGVQLEERDGAYILRKHTPSVTLRGETIHAQLDLGGVAKGYACDRVAALLRERGYALGHFVCGGSSMALLARPDGDGRYALTLRKPRPGAGRAAHFATLRARDVMLSTSADTSHSTTRDGVVYCHIIDPRTGWPVNTPSAGAQSGLATVTLLSDSAARSDALSTALCVMGEQAARAFVQSRLPDAQAVTVAYAADEQELFVWSNVDEASLEIEDALYHRIY